MRMSPLVSGMRRLTSLSAVVLPPPDGPTSTQISPAGTVSDSSSTAAAPRPGVDLRRVVEDELCGLALCRWPGIGPIFYERRASRPIVKSGRQLVELREREQDAVGERLAAGRVVADREQLPLAAEDHFLVRDEPRQTH